MTFIHFHMYKYLPLISYVQYLPTPPLDQDMTQGQFLSEV